MGMPLELNTLIVTKGKEKRLDDNLFLLEKARYRLYPIDIPIEVRRTIEGDITGTAVIQRIEWENQQTSIFYQLISLNSTN